MMPAMGRIYWLPWWSPAPADAHDAGHGSHVLAALLEPAPADAHDAVSCLIDLWYLWSLLQLMLMTSAMGRIYWLPCWSPAPADAHDPGHGSHVLAALLEPAPADAHDAVSCFIDLWYLWSLLQLMLMTSAMGRIYWLPCWGPAPANAYDAGFFFGFSPLICGICGACSG